MRHRATRERAPVVCRRAFEPWSGRTTRRSRPRAVLSAQLRRFPEIPRLRSLAFAHCDVLGMRKIAALDGCDLNPRVESVKRLAVYRAGKLPHKATR